MMSGFSQFSHSGLFADDIILQSSNLWAKKEKPQPGVDMKSHFPSLTAYVQKRCMLHNADSKS